MKWKFIGENDLDWIIKTARELHAESNWSKKVKFSEDKVKKYLKTFFLIIYRGGLVGDISCNNSCLAVVLRRLQ